MSDIGRWLEELGLGQYVDAFRENDIDESLLPDLTDGALKELGVASMGHRLKLLKALEARSGTDVVAEQIPGPIPDPLAKSALAQPDKPRTDAERRQLTVMFCDLVGSTGMSEALDPEDLRAVMAAYRQAAGDVVARYDGHVAQYLGDGLMVYFGWPRAHEDDAERAVRAGLEIVAAVKTVNAVAPLQVRLGIATGAVVVGEGSDDAQANKLAVGKTPNLAARLQGLAQPDQIVIGPGTRRLTRGAFDYEDLGPQSLKGIVEPVPASRVVGESGAADRFEATMSGRLTPLVGRDSELALLMDRWHQAADGEGQVVLLSGEPGIGKSRITQELRARLADEPHTRLRYQCSPYHINSALHPVIVQFEHAAGFSHDDTAEAKLDKVEAILEDGAGDAEGAALIASLLGLPVERYPPLELSTQRRKDQILQVLSDQVLALAARAPVLMIFEDAHWIDPTSREVLDLLIESVARHRVLAVITFRPEFEPPWSGEPHVTPLSVNRLARRHGAAMIAKVTGGKPLPEELLAQIVAKTDGIPLFVEELTKTILETGVLEETDSGYVLAGPLPDLAVPSSLRDSLMARIDRLEHVKEVAQIGACIGREFSRTMIAAVAQMAEDDLGDALDKLIATELVNRRGQTYTFKHALVQDAAYDSLLKVRRTELHGRIVDTLTTDASDSDKAPPQLLAYHAMEAGRTDLAVEKWYQAAVAARGRSEITEAIALLEKGLTVIAKATSLADQERWLFAYRAALAPLYMATRGGASPMADEMYESAIAMIDHAQSVEQAAPVMFGATLCWISCGKGDEARAMGERLLSQFRGRDQPVARMAVQNWAGMIAMFRAATREAIQSYDQVIADYDRGTHRHLGDAFGTDPLVMALAWKGYCQFEIGLLDQMQTSSADCLAWADTLGHRYSQHWAYWLAGADLQHFRRDSQAALHCATRGIELGNKYGFDNAMLRLHAGWAMVQLGQPDIGSTEMVDALDAIWQSGYRDVLAPRLTAQVAEALGQMGRPEDGLRLMRDAPDRKASGGKPRRFSDIYRAEGELLWALGDVDRDEVESFLREAVVIADEDDHITRGLRAATSYARFMIEHARAQEAYDVLAPRYAGFTEGFDTPDLTDAKGVLDKLASVGVREITTAGGGVYETL
jgi:class 3 adenylate cyclase/tetratricopeptide (TPR) repeat protein